ncbi:HNH endonuclease [Streptomyces sp. cg28]|uniref:HNH endonuclease n=1 Tax=Streptomyces sp. cg28 TaxID=3403457 RepID=UPI003B218216
MTKPTCSVPACERAHKGHGLCGTHLHRQRKGIPLEAGPLRQPRKGLICQISDCGRPVAGKGLCSLHWQRKQNGVPMDAPLQASNAGRDCSITDCVKPSRKRGWCSMHYARWRQHGDPTIVVTVEHLPCSVQGCERPGRTLGMCEFHKRRRRQGTPLEQALKPRGETCPVDGCGKPAQYRGLCKMHRERQNYAENPAPFKAKTARRRHQASRGMDGLDHALSDAYRAAIAADACAYCGNATEAMHVDHKFPLSKGGTDHWWNLAMACDHCNLAKYNRCNTAFRLLRGGGGREPLIAADVP